MLSHSSPKKIDGGSDLRDRALKFLNDPRLTEVVDGYIGKEEMEEGENLMTRRYLMCSLMFKNAQCQGAVVNLQISEVKRAICHKTKSGEEVYICPFNLKR